MRFSAGPSRYSRQFSGLQRFAQRGEMGYLANFFPLTPYSCSHFIMGARQHELKQPENLKSQQKQLNYGSELVIAQKFKVRVQFVPASYMKWVANTNPLILQCRVQDEILSALYISLDVSFGALMRPRTLHSLSKSVRFAHFSRNLAATLVLAPPTSSTVRKFSSSRGPRPTLFETAGLTVCNYTLYTQVLSLQDAFHLWFYP